MQIFSLIAFGVPFFCLALQAAEGLPPLPAAPKRPVTDEYHSVKVGEDYRWLEDLNDPEVRRWSDAQNRYTRAWLERIPARQPLLERLKELYTATSSRYFNLEYRHKALFGLKQQPPKNQPLLVTLASPDDPGSERVIVDPNALDPNGTTAIDFYVPSLDGRMVAVSLSEKGSEEGTVHIYQVATGERLSDAIPRVNGPTAGGSVTWNADASGFYYTRYPRGSERPAADLNFFQQVYFHKLGAPTGQDTYALGREFPRIGETALDASDDGRYTLASVRNGDGGEVAHFLRGPSGNWQQITRFSDKVTKAAFGPGDALYLLSRDKAPRGKILRLDPAKPDLASAAVVVKEGDAAIDQFVPAATRIYLAEVNGGPSEIRVVDLQGRTLKSVPIKPVSAVRQMLRTAGDEILFDNVSYVDPPAWYRYDPKSEAVTRTALVTTAPANFGDTEVVRAFATSTSGTKVPMSILRRKGVKLDGRNPVLLTAYGGYGIISAPSFLVRRRVWLDQGGVWVVANIRGGGEYGEEWHLAGNLTKKQNVFDDFAACARFLIDQKYTSAEHLAIEGGSNGGLLMGAALTQHPELYRAVVSHVGIYDMLRVELSPNGAFNVTEFGTVKDPAQFKALYAYSPYHHVTDGIAYPAVMFLTGDHDGRVDPANSRKMTARLQAAMRSDRPVLLRTSSSSGHGVDTGLSERITTDADVFTFLFDQLGMSYRRSQ